MSATDLVLFVAALLDRLAIPYMLVGSYSSNYYGRPRSTHDADFVVVISDADIVKLRQEVGPEYVFDPQMSFEGITMTSRHLLTHRATTFRIELFLLTDDPFDRSRFERRHQVNLDGAQLWLPTAEDVIVQKLRWSRGGRRGKDITDAEQVMQVQKDRLDLSYVRRWTEQHHTTDLLDVLLVKAGLES